MKKLIYAALTALLLLATLAVSVSAAQEPTAALTAKETVYRGDTVSVSVTLDAPSTATIGLIPEWDSNTLEWLGGTWENIDGITLANVQLAAKTASCAISPANDVSGKIITLNFKVKDTAELDQTKIDVTLLVKTNQEQVQLDVSTTVEIACNHSFTETVQKDEYKKNDASCTEKLTYYKSCKCGEKGTETFTVGELLAHTFTESVQKDEYKKNDASCTEKLTYYKSCKCGAKGTETFTVGELLAHTFTESVQKDEYKKNDASCTEKLTYYKSCKCGAKGTQTFTVGNALGHKYKTEWTTSSTAHWHVCSACGDQKDMAVHTPGPAATETTAQTCTECGYVIAAALNHTHVWGSEWFTNEAMHWVKCSCGETASATHEFDSACDTECNECKYVRAVTHSYKTEWSSGENGHWHECTACGAKKDEAAHVAGPEATEEAAQVCTECSFVIKEKLEHTHSFGTEFEKDAENHWHVCDKCGEKSSLEAHDFDSGLVTVKPTEKKEGVKTFTCKTCGLTKTESIKKLEKSEKKGGCSASATSTLALISLFVCAPACVLFKKKKF